MTLKIVQAQLKIYLKIEIILFFKHLGIKVSKRDFIKEKIDLILLDIELKMEMEKHF